MKISKLLIAPIALSSLLAFNAQANSDWTNWTSASSLSPSVTGSLIDGATTITVTATGAYSFAHTGESSSNINYWNPSTPYISSGVTAPTSSDIIALNTAGTETITFSQAVVNPLIALVSWNGANVSFGNDPITFLSHGCGYWGCGTPILNSTNTGFTGNGELHGVVEVIGTYTSISFTDSISENWHGFTVGVEGVAPNGQRPNQLPLRCLPQA